MLLARYSTPIEIKNPVKQNLYHIEHLSKILISGGENYGNVIVFGEETRYPIMKPPRNTMICNLRYIDKPIQHLKIKELDLDTINQVIDILDEVANRVTASNSFVKKNI